MQPHDYLVIPEVYGPKIATMAPGFKKVIFNQNSYYTFQGYSLDPKDMTAPYFHKEVVATLVISEDNKRYLSYAFPDLNLFRIQYGFNPNIFNYSGHKKKQICYMPRKHPEDALQVLNIFKFRNPLSDFEIVPIDNQPEDRVAKIFKESLIFLSFGYPESFSMPPAEAMACGCAVIGYHGQGGREYFKPEFSYPIEVGDILGFAKALEEVTQQYEVEPEYILKKGREASNYILSEYSLEKEEASILEVWKRILNRQEKYLCHAPIIRDFSEFSGISLERIESFINNHHQLAASEWNDIPADEYSDKALEFYKSSKYYIYDLLEGNYNKHSLINKLHSFNRLILQSIKKHPGQDFIEFGGGTGLFCEIVLQLGKQVTYLDIPGKVFDFATWRFKKYNLPIKAICSEPGNLVLEKTYDIIFSDAVLEHVIDPEGVVDKLCKHLNDGGLLILLVDLAGHAEDYPMHQDIDIRKLHEVVKTNGLMNVAGENTFCSIWRKPGG